MCSTEYRAVFTHIFLFIPSCLSFPKTPLLNPNRTSFDRCMHSHCTECFLFEVVHEVSNEPTTDFTMLVEGTHDIYIYFMGQANRLPGVFGNEVTIKRCNNCNRLRFHCSHTNPNVVSVFKIPKNADTVTLQVEWTPRHILQAALHGTSFFPFSRFY